MPFHLIGPVVSSGPSFCPVLTDWVSITGYWGRCTAPTLSGHAGPALGLLAPTSPPSATCGSSGRAWTSGVAHTVQPAACCYFPSRKRLALWFIWGRGPRGAVYVALGVSPLGERQILGWKIAFG